MVRYRQATFVLQRHGSLSGDFLQLASSSTFLGWDLSTEQVGVAIEALPVLTELLASLADALLVSIAILFDEKGPVVAVLLILMVA